MQPLLIVKSKESICNYFILYNPLSYLISLGKFPAACGVFLSFLFQ